ncbi:MAG: hypothetical protein GY948_25480, partial [Alphaproteobacteria bacterium]|nr:hypothetical protein [Alphaproteobacteria bacterium]
VVLGRLVPDAVQGVLNADAFHFGSEATTAEQQFLYDGRTLSYDADGSGSGAAQAIAQFDGNPVLTADDIFMAQFAFVMRERLW